MKTTSHSVMFALVVVLAGQVLAQTAKRPAPSADDAVANQWSFSLATSGYLIPADQSYGSPTFTADHSWLHLEARYNYEYQRTGSLWAGYNFTVGTKLVLDATPMFGVVVGSTTGIAPGYELSLAYRRVDSPLRVNTYLIRTIGIPVFSIPGSKAVRLRPDVIVTDFAMPLLNGLDAAQRIREQLPNARFVFLTMHDDANLAAAALELGQEAFVLKSSSGPELLKAIEEILHGRSYLTPRLRAEDWVTAKARARQFSKELTKRQRDFVQLFAEGRPTKEIAGVLDLSEKTVEFHKHHIMQVFNLKSNADLVLFGLKHGLIGVDPDPHQWSLAS